MSGRADRIDLHAGVHDSGNSDSLFYFPGIKEMARHSDVRRFVPDADEFGHPGVRLDQHPRQERDRQSDPGNAGLIDQPLSMLYTEFSVLVGTIYLFLPLMIITLVGVMESIDNDMMEAAESLAPAGALLLQSHSADVDSRHHHRFGAGVYRSDDGIYDAAAVRRTEKHVCCRR